MEGVILLNFAHPLTPEQIREAEDLLGHPIKKVISVPTEFEPEKSFVSQAEELLGQIELSPTEWQTERIVVVPPSLNYIAVLFLAELHGRMGYFPPHLRLRPSDSSLSGFKVAEILHLQNVREEARKKRGKKPCS